MIKKKNNSSQLKLKPQFNIESFLKRYGDEDADYAEPYLLHYFNLDKIKKNLIRNDNFEKLFWQTNAFNFKSIFPEDKNDKKCKPYQPSDTVNKNSQQKFDKDFNPRYLIEEKARYGHVEPDECEWFKDFLQPFIDNPSLLSPIPKKFVSKSIDLPNIIKRIAKKQQLTLKEVNAIKYLCSHKDNSNLQNKPFINKQSKINYKSKLAIQKYANNNLNTQKPVNKKFRHKFNYQHKRILNAKKQNFKNTTKI